MKSDKAQTLLEFQDIPGVGKSIAGDLWLLGFRSIDELQKADPEKMYTDFETMVGTKVDRCLLYVFRCAVYYASNTRHDPELLKWWNWKEKTTPSVKIRKRR